MTTEIQNRDAAQQSGQELTSELVNHLNACLTMVRPAWMNDEAAAEWLTIAVSDLRHLSPRTVAMAAKEARGKCTHHGQIVPAILASSAVSDERKFKALNWGGRDAAWEQRKAEIEGKTDSQKLIASTARRLKA